MRINSTTSNLAYSYDSREQWMKKKRQNTSNDISMTIKQEVRKMPSLLAWRDVHECIYLDRAGRLEYTWQCWQTRPSDRWSQPPTGVQWWTCYYHHSNQRKKNQVWRQIHTKPSTRILIINLNEDARNAKLIWGRKCLLVAEAFHQRVVINADLRWTHGYANWTPWWTFELMDISDIRPLTLTCVGQTYGLVTDHIKHSATYPWWSDSWTHDHMRHRATDADPRWSDSWTHDHMRHRATEAGWLVVVRLTDTCQL